MRTAGGGCQEGWGNQRGEAAREQGTGQSQVRRKTGLQEEATASPRLRSQLGKEKPREEVAAERRTGEPA